MTEATFTFVSVFEANVPIICSAHVFNIGRFTAFPAKKQYGSINAERNQSTHCYVFVLPNIACDDKHVKSAEVFIVWPRPKRGC